MIFTSPRPSLLFKNDHWRFVNSLFHKYDYGEKGLPTPIVKKKLGPKELVEWGE
jgi:hypothetical protein